MRCYNHDNRRAASDILVDAVRYYLCSYCARELVQRLNRGKSLVLDSVVARLHGGSGTSVPATRITRAGWCLVHKVDHVEELRSCEYDDERPKDDVGAD